MKSAMAFPAPRYSPPSNNTNKEAANTASHQHDDNIRDVADRFLIRIRDVLLTQNGNGEFLKYEISPAVFTTDFVPNARVFCNSVIPSTTTELVSVGYYERRSGATTREGWLEAKVKNHRLRMLRFSMTNNMSQSKQEFLKNLLFDHVRPMFAELFPNRIDLNNSFMWPASRFNSSSCIGDNNQLHDNTNNISVIMKPRKRRSDCGMELSEALKRYEASKKAGAGAATSTKKITSKTQEPSLSSVLMNEKGACGSNNDYDVDVVKKDNDKRMIANNRWGLIILIVVLSIVSLWYLDKFLYKRNFH